MKRLTAMYRDAQSQFRAKLSDQKGATMVEYALMVSLIAVVSILAVTDIGTSARDVFAAVAAAVNPPAP